MKKILQAFKKLFKGKRNEKPKEFYICDPQRNQGCSKNGCWEIYHGPCKCTASLKYAKRHDDGTPVVAKDEDLYNLDWADYWMMKAQEEAKAKRDAGIQDL